MSSQGQFDNTQKDNLAGAEEYVARIINEIRFDDSADGASYLRGKAAEAAATVFEKEKKKAFNISGGSLESGTIAMLQDCAMLADLKAAKGPGNEKKTWRKLGKFFSTAATHMAGAEISPRAIAQKAVAVAFEP